MDRIFNMENYNSIERLFFELLGREQELLVLKRRILSLQANIGDGVSILELEAHADRQFEEPKLPIGKTSFLVYKNHKYTTVQTSSVAYFFIKNGCTFIMCFDQKEYTLNYSLDKIATLISPGRFFRLNRKHLINFDAILEVEHYFMRKLVVKLVIDTKEKLLINKDKAQCFLNWMENR
jgi:DNA-binding LytR/AlgR family response regulator